MPRDGFPDRPPRRGGARPAPRSRRERSPSSRRKESRRRRHRKKREQERIARELRERKEKEELAVRQARLDEKEKKIAAREAALRREEEEQKRAASEKAASERAARTRRRDPESRRSEEEQNREEEEIASRQEVRPEPRRQEPLTDDVDDIDVEAVQEPADDLCGWWELTNRIEETNYETLPRPAPRLSSPARAGRRPDHRPRPEVVGGRPHPPRRRAHADHRPRHGRGRHVLLEFTEHGARRSTNGSFQWRIARNGSTLRGSFESTAAATSGHSVARRLD